METSGVHLKRNGILRVQHSLDISRLFEGKVRQNILRVFFSMSCCALLLEIKIKKIIIFISAKDIENHWKEDD